MSDNSLYTGITTDLKRRIKEHTHKLKPAAAYTKSRDVVRLEAVWTTEDRSSASKLEAQIKKLPKLKKEALVLNPSQLDETYHPVEKDYIEKIK